jgi:outer membrane autotransporter protein
VAGVPIAEDSALVGAGFDYAFNSSVSAGLAYSGQFGDGTTDNALKGTLDVRF